MNKIEFKLDRNDPDRYKKQRQLLQAIGSKNKSVSMKAQEIFAELIGPVVSEAINQMATSALIYNTIRIDQDSDPTIAVDPYENNNEGLIDIWSQAAPGGLPTNHVTNVEEFRVPLSTLDSAVSMLKRHARGSRSDVVAKAMNRMAQELLLKREYQAWTPIMAGVAQARTDSSAHVISATTTGVFQLDDLNRLLTKVRRFNASWAGGTPVSTGIGLTDLIISPEIMEDIRGFTYQPMNTRAVPNTDESTALGLPDSIREQFFRNVVPSLFGVNLIELNEFGVGEAFTSLFNQFYSPGGGDPTFTAASQELVLGVDMGSDAFIRMVEVDGDDPHPQDYTVLVDDQWVARSEKVGWYTAGREGHALIEKRAVCGVIV